MVQRQPTTIKTKTKKANPEVKGDSDFQSYHIIQSKRPVFKKISHSIQRNRKVRPIQKKK